MYRRGRPGRDRSRDQSRPFPQARDRDRDRDYDSRYRREERHQSGHWGEDLDRRAEERRRDERPHPPTVLPPLPPPPAVEPSSFVRDASKVTNARRESRDSTRDIPPVDTTRRHSGGSSSLSLRKEYSEPSPRERGMIGDPPRRQNTGSSWRDRDRDRDRDDERARSDTVRSRKNSLERNPDLPFHSPIAESPRSFVPPASPATPISAVPPHSMAPSAPLSLAGNHSIAATDNKNTMLSRVFLEASYAYAKFLETQSSWKVAEKERNDHAEHFNAFPALKDRYEGNLKAAKKDYQSATETFNKKSTYLDRLCTKLLEERLSQRDSESAIELCDKIKKELGSSLSLTQFVKSNTPAPAPAPSKDEFQELRNEFQEMRRRQEEEEKTRQNEFRNYKTEQANRLKSQDAKLTRYGAIQDELKADIGRMKDEHRKTSEELNKAMTLLTTMKNSVDKLEDAGNQKNGGDVVMGDVVSDGVLSGVRKTLETLQKDVTTNQNSISETSIRFKDIDDTVTQVKNEAKTLQHMISKLETLGIFQDTGPGEVLSGGRGAVSHENCATKTDIEQLARNIKAQDDVLDVMQEHAEKDTTAILEEVRTLEQKAETHIQTTGEKIQALDQKTSEQIATLLTHQEATKIKDEIKGISEKFEQHFGSFHNKFISEVERLDRKVGFVENQLESHVLAITHQEQRMNNFTTKDFYDRVVQSLAQMNPLLFDYANQLQHCSNEIKAIKESMRTLATRLDTAKQRLAAVAQSPHPAIHDRSSIDASSNGAGVKSDGLSEGPSPPIHAIFQNLESHNSEINKLKQLIDDHIKTYTAKMGDIKEWTVSATQRLAENTELVNIAMNEIKELRACMSTIDQRSGSPQIPPTTAAIDRWRAVGSNQEAMQGLSDENGTG